MQGKGTIYYIDKRIYEGNFEKSLKEGKGLWKYSDGSTMQSSYKNGEIDGKAIHIFKNAQGITNYNLRNYKNGKLISQKLYKRKPSMGGNCCRVF